MANLDNYSNPMTPELTSVPPLATTGKPAVPWEAAQQQLNRFVRNHCCNRENRKRPRHAGILVGDCRPPRRVLYGPGHRFLVRDVDSLPRGFQGIQPSKQIG
ncbi:unnamed protein product [Urochloa humidicola]